MQNLVRGVRRFRDEVFATRREEYQRLAAGQKPHTLFITCSDSRLDPELITSSRPGDIFVLRNAGNLVPPYGAGHGGEAATIEYAVAGLGVKHVVVCGHTGCGAMKALLERDSCAELPMVADWLSHAEAARAVVRSKHADASGIQGRWHAAVEENVLLQLEHLKTHPTVAGGLATGDLILYGWVFELHTGCVTSFDPALGRFVPLPDDPDGSAFIPPSVPFRNGRAKKGAVAR